MNYNAAILTVVFITMACLVSGQRISETNLAFGISKTSSTEFKQRFEEALPVYLTLMGSKSWYANNHRMSLIKEAGLNLQYEHIDFSGGGLGAGNHYTGSIVSLFANASLQARLRISQTLAFGIGPEAEVLLIGNSNLNNEYYSVFYKPPRSGNEKTGGLNRDYFNEPSYGLKASLMESNADSKVSVGLSMSYLWTNSEPANFYAERYTRFSIVIGFKKQKDQSPGKSNL